MAGGLGKALSQVSIGDLLAVGAGGCFDTVLP